MGCKQAGLGRVFFCPFRYIYLHFIAKKVMEVTLTEAERIAHQATGERRAEIEGRRYHMGAEPTPGLGYDDRLTVRLGLSATTVYKYLALPEQRGGIRHRRMGKKYYVTELALREWAGDLKAAA
jgi:hypothetical protein